MNGANTHKHVTGGSYRNKLYTSLLAELGSGSQISEQPDVN